MKKIYVLPNLVTTANLFCGFYSITESLQFDFNPAAWAILAATLFDALDGRVARLAKATSRFGVEYDSLSDLVSFGVAPSLFLYQWAFAPYDRFGVLLAFLFLTCGALRLARFNVTSERLPKGFFQGLPIPGAASTVASFYLFNQTLGLIEPPHGSIVAMSAFLSTLMVSTLPFPSFKEVNWKSRAQFGYLMVGILTMILLATRPQVTLFLTLAAYIVVGSIYGMIRLVFYRQGTQTQTRVTS